MRFKSWEGFQLSIMVGHGIIGDVSDDVYVS
jgi:hypothetical protein